MDEPFDARIRAQTRGFGRGSSPIQRWLQAGHQNIRLLRVLFSSTPYGCLQDGQTSPVRMGFAGNWIRSELVVVPVYGPERQRPEVPVAWLGGARWLFGPFVFADTALEYSQNDAAH